MSDSWLGYIAKLAATVAVTTAGKFALNAALPGLGSTVDLAQAGIAFHQGDMAGCAANLISAAADLGTLGLAGIIKDAMKGSAKEAVVQTAKETAKLAEKEATKKVGQELSKQLAKGVIKGGKEAAIQAAKGAASTAAKDASKRVGQLVSTEIARGVLAEAVEEAWRESTKKSLQTIICTELISSGGKQVFKSVSEGVAHVLTPNMLEKLIGEGIKQNSKKFVFYLTKDAAKTAAKAEYKKHAYKLLIKDLAALF